MAATEFQRLVCRPIAQNLRNRGESYVAEGIALNTLTGAARVSRDIDLFHDTREAVATSFQEHRRLLESHGFEVRLQRESPTFVEALIVRGGDSVEFQWAPDSAFRFFPLVEHEDFGLTLHPFDLATNKVLALVGRLEPRDWVDVITCSERIQPLGYFAWAACAKDPGFSPAMILEQAARSSRYSREEIAALAFEGPPPDAADLSRRWHQQLEQARSIVTILPPEEGGKCVLDESGSLFTGGLQELQQAIAASKIRYHEGRIRGAVPRLNGM